MNSLFSSAKHDWETPWHFFRQLDSEFHFTLDPCCYEHTAKCKKHFTIREDGLAQDWGGEHVFCNPPYGKAIAAWVNKCFAESQKKQTVIVLLIPARTDTNYFHEFIFGKASEIRFVKGRLRFAPSKCPAPFPSMVVVYNKDQNKNILPCSDIFKISTMHSNM